MKLTIAISPFLALNGIPPTTNLTGSSYNFFRGILTVVFSFVETICSPET